MEKESVQFMLKIALGPNNANTECLTSQNHTKLGTWGMDAVIVYKSCIMLKIEKKLGAV